MRNGAILIHESEGSALGGGSSRFMGEIGQSGIEGMERNLQNAKQLEELKSNQEEEHTNFRLEHSTRLHRTQRTNKNDVCLSGEKPLRLTAHTRCKPGPALINRCEGKKCCPMSQAKIK
jgi:hypothetical protein